MLQWCREKLNENSVILMRKGKLYLPKRHVKQPKKRKGGRIRKKKDSNNKQLDSFHLTSTLPFPKSTCIVIQPIIPTSFKIGRQATILGNQFLCQSDLRKGNYFKCNTTQTLAILTFSENRAFFCTWSSKREILLNLTFPIYFYN